jgi:1,4-dihydroxy-2-naphthoate octaprenyltransferase
VKFFQERYKVFLTATRPGDWRFSFIPFIFGNLYLWMIMLDIAFSLQSLILLLLSLTTSFGFAALGYFINEFFDIKDDAIAGKINKILLLSPLKQLILFLGIVAFTFLPWLWLPFNKFSILLIVLQLLSFVFYSVPPFRLKKSALVSGFLDASYAYILPMLLSYYTFALFAENAQYFSIIAFYGFFLFIIGFRNITIHHINDIFRDKKSGIITLPRLLGVQNTNLLLWCFLIAELLLLIVFCILLIRVHIGFMLLLLPYFFVVYKTYSLAPDDKVIVFHPVRQSPDIFYQLWFPIISLCILVSSDFYFVVILPLHAFLFIDPQYFEKLKDYLVLIWADYIRYVISFLINYVIHGLFLLVGINLKKENLSAIEYLKRRFK